MQVGSWTKSTEKLQFLANKEMESKVRKNIVEFNLILHLIKNPFPWLCKVVKKISNFLNDY